MYVLSSETQTVSGIQIYQLQTRSIQNWELEQELIGRLGGERQICSVEGGGRGCESEERPQSISSPLHARVCVCAHAPHMHMHTHTQDWEKLVSGHKM